MLTSASLKAAVFGGIYCHGKKCSRDKIFLYVEQMSQGRRTSSLKASYAAVSQGVSKDLNLGSVAAAPSPLPAEPPKVPRNKKYVPEKKKRN